MSTWAKLCQAFYVKFLFFTLHDWNQNQLRSEKIHALRLQSCRFDFSFCLRMTRNSLRILSFLRVANAFFWFAPIPSEGWHTMSLTLVEGLCSGWKIQEQAQAYYQDEHCSHQARCCLANVPEPNDLSHRRPLQKLLSSSLPAFGNYQDLNAPSHTRFIQITRFG